MSRRSHLESHALRQAAIVAAAALFASVAFAATPNFPITAEQRSTAARAAEAGVPLSDI